MKKEQPGKGHSSAVALFLVAIALAFSIVFFVASVGFGGDEKPAPINVAAKPEPPLPVPECVGNETQPCESGGCFGKRLCDSGYFSDCIMQRKVCSPGQRIGCSIDGCRFGYKVCNECGSGFGNCLLENLNSTGNCSGDACG